jgi:DNA-binding NarL/FixJ family response regulator
LGIAGGVTQIIQALGSGAHVVLASGARDLPERAATLGAAAYLLKPFGPEQLVATVEKIAGGG